jgi:transposase-like protein
MGRRSFSREFKLEAVKLVKERGVSVTQAAKDLGLSQSVLQADLDAWISSYNHERTHQGKMCCGRTPMATFEDGKEICREKLIA